MNNSNLRAIILAAAGLSLAGCSGIFPYKNDGATENVTLTPQLSTGSVRMDVYEIDASCKETYVGSVQPGSHPAKVALPVNQERYLAVVFEQSSFFTGSSSLATGQYFKAQPGAVYEIKASYSDTTHDMEIREHLHGRWREIPDTPPPACTKASG